MDWKSQTVYGRTALIFRTLCPWLYDVLAGKLFDKIIRCDNRQADGDMTTWSAKNFIKVKTIGGKSFKIQWNTGYINISCIACYNYVGEQYII